MDRETLEARLLSGAATDEEKARLQLLLDHHRSLDMARTQETILQGQYHMYINQESLLGRMAALVSDMSVLRVFDLALAVLLGFGVYLVFQKALG